MRNISLDSIISNTIIDLEIKGIIPIQSPDQAHVLNQKKILVLQHTNNTISMHSSSKAKLTDDALMELVQQQDDRSAFAELYRRYWQSLIDAAFQRTNSIEHAEELVQDIFVSFFLRRKEIEIHSTLESYLKTALKYRFFNSYREKKSRELHLQIISNKEENQPILPDVLLQTKELQQKIKKAADKLPEKCREVFMLSRFEELSQNEIADRLNISLSTVKKHMTKALTIMRAEIGDHHNELLAVCIFVYSAKHL